MRTACVLLCSILVGNAADAEIAKLPEPYQTLAELARSAPPEFTADALLRLVEQGRLVDKNARRDLIEEAFRIASAAKLPVRMDGLPGTTTDTGSGSLSRAYALKFDALSLQSRAVKDMMAVDPAAARRLFTEIARPMLPALTCDDALFYDLSDYYQALSAVVNGAFTPKERANQDQVNFLADYLGQATSPLEFASLIPVVETVSVSNQQRQGLWARLGGMFESVQPDDRTYSASLQVLTSANIPELQSSLEKYRQKSSGCASDVTTASGIAKGQATPQRPKTPKVNAYWQSANSQRLLEPGKKLRYDKNNLPLSEADRSTPEWQGQVNDYLNQITDWTPDQESSESDYFHEKCTVLTALIELVPPGAENDRIVADYVAFISNSNLYRESPAEWYLEPHTLLERFRPASPMRKALLDAYQQSGNPILTLEVTLERASHPGH